MANFEAEQARKDAKKTETVTFNREQQIQRSAKDPATLGKEALEKREFDLAITHYTTAISSTPQAGPYYTQRSRAYLRVSPPRLTEALSDAEIGVVLAHKRNVLEVIADAQMQRARIFWRLERYGDAVQCFDWGFNRIDDDYKPKDEDFATTLKASRTLRGMAEEKLAKFENDASKAQVTVQRVPDIDVEHIGNDSRKQNPLSAHGRSAAGETPTNNGQPAPTLEKKPEAMQTPASEIRHDWYQQRDTVCITLLVRGVPKDNTTVDIQPHSLAISFPLPTGSDFDFSLDPLYAEIDPEASSYRIAATKVEVTLKKVVVGQKWHALERSASLPSTQSVSNTAADDAIKRAVLNSPTNATAPAYPTSSRSGPKNWDKLAEDLTKRPVKKVESSDAAVDDPAKTTSETTGADDWVDDDEGGDPASAFFKKIFKNADPDTRRAMMKSYQESNGTALSTNWDEVGKKKMETSPPDGMVAKKWEE